MPIKRIKVLHVMARMNVGGTANYMADLLPKLASEKFEVLLAVGRIQKGEVEDSRLEELNFTRIESLGRRLNLFNDVKSYFALRGIVREFQPQIIHSHTFKAGLLSRLMFFKVPKVHTFHGHLFTDPEFSRLKIVLDKIIEKILANFTKKLVVTGGQVAADLINSGVGEESKYISIPGEVSLRSLTSRKTVREKLFLSEEFVVLWMGRFAPVKNPALLIKVARFMPECVFVVAGEGILFESIKAEAPSNVKLLGFVNVEEIILAGDVLLSTSLNEGIPYALLEAQTAGLPIVAVNSGGVSEVVSAGENGFLTEPSAEAISSRIRELMLDSSLRTKMSECALECSHSRKLLQGMSVQHAQMYREILTLG